MLVYRHKIVRTEETARYLDHEGRTVVHFVNIYSRGSTGHGLRRNYKKVGDGPPIFQGDD